MSTNPERYLHCNSCHYSFVSRADLLYVAVCPSCGSRKCIPVENREDKEDTIKVRVDKKIEVILECPNCGYKTEAAVGQVIDPTCPVCKTKMKEQKDLNNRPGILKEAFHTINDERQDQYGKPEDSFKIIAEFWTTYIKHKFGIIVELNNLDIAHMMSLFKQARMLGQKSHRDNYIDACGYLAIAADRLIRWPEPFDPDEL